MFEGHDSIGNPFSLGQSLYVWPVLLVARRIQHRVHKLHLTTEAVRQDAIDGVLVLGNGGAVGEDNTNSRQHPTPDRLRLFRVERTKVEERSPLPRILGASDLAGFLVDERERTIAERPAFCQE